MLERLERKSVELSKKEKKKFEYLKNEIDATIAACLTGDKENLVQAYNLRNGIRDTSQFSYLWAAYGIEFPSQMRHIPTLRAIFDSLVGMAIHRPFKYHISCVNSDAVNQIFNEYRDQILADFDRYWKNRILAAQMVAQGQSSEAESARQHLDRLQRKYKSGDFKSDIEKLSKDMLDWAVNRFKLQSFVPRFAEDLITAGQAYYQVKVEQVGKKPLIRVLNPLNLYYTKSPDTRWIRDCDRVVYKERMPVTEVWTLYGHRMTKPDQERFMENWGKYIVGSDMEIMDYAFGSLERTIDFNIQKGIEIPMIDVSYVEWKANTRVVVREPDPDMEPVVDSDMDVKLSRLRTRYKFQLDRYEGVRIGEDIYVNAGESKFVVRDPDDPSDVKLTINGLCYNDRNGEPYSLVLKTKDIADKIDILHYHAENLLALSGTKAIMVNFPDIPVWLDANHMKRLMKWLGLVKQGVALVDMSQEGNGSGKFSNMGDADLEMSQAIITIWDMIDRLEAIAYKVTGVSRQSVGSITQNDGKGTSEIAIQGTQVVTAPLFYTLDEIVEEFLTDVVNACRIAYSEGLQGKIVLGHEGQKIFSIKKDQFKLVHFNVHVNGDGTEERDIEEIKLIAQKFIDNQMLDIELGFDLVTMKSLSDIRNRVKQAVAEGKDNVQQQMSQQLEELTRELEQAKRLITELQTKDMDYKQAQLQQRQTEIDGKLANEKAKLDQNALIEAEKLRLESKRVDLEALQLEYGDNGRAKEIRND